MAERQTRVAVKVELVGGVPIAELLGLPPTRVVVQLKRPARLQSAASWLKQYSGKNVLRGYCKHFGGDW